MEVCVKKKPITQESKQLLLSEGIEVQAIEEEEKKKKKKRDKEKEIPNYDFYEIPPHVEWINQWKDYDVWYKENGEY